jgi:plasmid stabilization system protein ParE
VGRRSPRSARAAARRARLRRLSLREEAEREVLAAALHYESERPGLGFRFEAELNRTITRVVESPLQFREIEPGVRRALLPIFPYGVFFTADEDDVLVMAVLHLHRHPDAWKGRR